MADIGDDHENLIDREIVKESCLICVQTELATCGYLIPLQAIPDRY